MFRLMELAGLLGPVAAVVLLVLWRGVIPSRAMVAAVVGCVLAGAASVLAVVGERAVLFSGGEGVMERLELVSMARWVLLAAGIASLSWAALQERGAAGRPSGWIGGGWALTGLGAAVAVVGVVLAHSLGESESGLSSLVQIVGDTVQFAALGLAVVVLSIGVAARRVDGDRDAGAQAVDLAGRAWRAYQGYRVARR